MRDDAESVKRARMLRATATDQRLLARMTPRLILASSSRYRRELLARLGIDFDRASPDVDESPLPSESPAALVLRLAELKARKVGDGEPGAVVIGSDQVAVHEGKVLGKPGTVANAERQLARLSGQRVDFLTGVALLNTTTGRLQTHTDRTTTTFRRLPEAEIRRYVELDQPLDCAGAIKSESRGVMLFERVETEDPTAAIGLPLIRLAALLRNEGINPLGG